MPLKAVTFDLWQTLLLDTPEQSEARHTRRLRETARLLAAWGLHYDLQQLAVGFAAAQQTWTVVNQLGAELSLRQKIITFLSAVDPHLLAVLDPRQIETLAMVPARAVQEVPPAPAPGARELLRALNAAGVRIGLISNTSISPGFALRRALGALGLNNNISIFTFSDELGVGKPARAVFLLTLARLEVAPHDAVHVGDDPYLDLSGAKAAGMRVVLVSDRPVPEGCPDPDAQVTNLREAGVALHQLAGEFVEPPAPPLVR